MNFSYTEEQNLLRDSVARFIQKDYTFEKRREILRSPEGWSRAVWAQLAEMGLLGMAIPAEHGGFGGSMVDTMLAMQAIGNGLVVEPYLATVVLGGGALVLAGSAEQRESVLPKIVEGATTLALAATEAGGRYSPAHVETKATKAGGGWKLSGAKAVVLHGGQAEQLVVSARTAGGAADADGITLFLVDAKAAGVSVRDYRTIDGLRAADVTLADVAVPASAVIGTVDAGLPVLEAVTDRGIAAVCAEAVGVMETLGQLTLEYIKTRQQFGQPIGRFQVLQHRAVDIFIQTELAKSMAVLAAMKADDADAAARRHACSAAKVQIGRGGRAVAQSAIQMHGGMGMTDELAASHYAKRLTMIDFQLGDAEHHLDRFIAA
jgi:alkylation response protein AidB-like acyl-CoA dehydrogenase